MPTLRSPLALKLFFGHERVQLALNVRTRSGYAALVALLRGLRSGAPLLQVLRPQREQFASDIALGFIEPLEPLAVRTPAQRPVLVVHGAPASLSPVELGLAAALQSDVHERIRHP